MYGGETRARTNGLVLLLGRLGRFRKHNATSNRDVTCLGMAWTRLPVDREVASAWPSQREELLSDVLRAAPCFWGPLTPFSLQYRLRQHVRLSPPRSMMTYHVAIWRRVVFSKSAYKQTQCAPYVTEKDQDQEVIQGCIDKEKNSVTDL